MLNRFLVNPAIDNAKKIWIRAVYALFVAAADGDANKIRFTRDAVALKLIQFELQLPPTPARFQELQALLTLIRDEWLELIDHFPLDQKNNLKMLLDETTQLLARSDPTAWKVRWAAAGALTLIACWIAGVSLIRHLV